MNEKFSDINLVPGYSYLFTLPDHETDEDMVFVYKY